MGKKVASIIAYVLILLLIVGIIAFVAVFTRGFTSDFATFYVVYANENVFGESKPKVLIADTEQRFEVKYTFGIFANKDNTDYSVAIVPYITDDTAFTYRMDGEDCLFELDAEKDFGAYFGVVKHDGFFTVNIPYEVDMQACLESMYTDSTVTVDDTVDISALPYFAIKVKSYNGKSTVLIPFTVYKSTDGIVIDPGEIIV